jgi:methyl-accepting chemotaxis protein
VELSVQDFGTLTGRVTQSTPSGSILSFEIDSGTKARLGEFLYGYQALDQPFVRAVKETAKLVGKAFEKAVDSGEIKLEDLFDESYQPIVGSNPPQFSSRFMALADKTLPQLQDPVLNFNPKVVFCVAADRNGYVATHNANYSKPQGSDPVWNAANCRNRRMFNNHSELKDARNTNDHLVQTYIRDMGGGAVMLLKSATAPIMVKGKHWGGLRIGYKL